MKAIFGPSSRQGPQALLRLRDAGFWSRRRLEIRHGLRIAAAGLASYSIAEWLQLPQAYWAVFTAILVVQTSVGGSWKASVDRLLGTLLGAVCGAAVASLVPHGDPFTTGAALALSLLPLSLLAAFNPAYRVAPITAIILLLGTAGATQGPVRAAMLRTLEVALGGICGMAVSLYLLPARAHMLLGESADRVLQQLAVLFSELISALTRTAPAATILAKQDAVRNALTALETVTAEAARETRNHLSEDVDPEPIARTLRRVRHDLILIGRVASLPVVEVPSPLLDASLRDFARTGSEYLHGLGKAFAMRASPPSRESFDTATRQVLAALQEIEAAERVVALRFCLQQLQQNLQDLHQRAMEFASVRTRA